MIAGRSVLGLVVARGGSKGLPGKNLRMLCGKPLIGWTVDAARAARFLDAVVVSTDDEGIAAAAAAHGAEVPFMRPAHLATDEASSIDVVLHALDWLASHGRDFDLVVLLEPTSPLRDANDIEQALERLTAAGADSLVSVCRAESAHPVFMFRAGPDGKLERYIPMAGQGPRRQDIEPLFFLEGTVYVSTVASLRQLQSFCHTGTIAFEVPKWKATEVDDAIDWVIVEALLRHKGLAS